MQAKQKIMDLARRLASKSNHPQHKVGCVIVKKGRIIDVGFNQLKTHTKSKAYGCYLHAEVHALLGNALEVTCGATVYVVRSRRCGSTGISKPCPSCEAALRAAGVKDVYYSDDNNEMVYWRLD